jgi:hypothetical protein
MTRFCEEKEEGGGKLLLIAISYNNETLLNVWYAPNFHCFLFFWQIFIDQYASCGVSKYYY